MSVIIFGIAFVLVGVALITWIVLASTQRLTISRIQRFIEANDQDWWNEIRKRSAVSSFRPPIQVILETYQSQTPTNKTVAEMCSRLERLNRVSTWVNAVLIGSAVVFLISLLVSRPAE